MNRSVDWMLIGLLFVSTALHAGLFAALNGWAPPRPTPAMPAVQIELSAPSSRDATAAPSRTGKAPSAMTKNVSLPKHFRHSPAKAPKPPSPSPPSTRASRRKIPLPVIRAIAAPPPLHLAAVTSPAPSPEPEPEATPRPAPSPKKIREPRPHRQPWPGPATRSISPSVPVAATTSMPEAKPAPQEGTKPGLDKSAGISSAAANRNTDAPPAGHGPPGPEMDRYLHRIVQRIEAEKHYPLIARTRRIEGRTTVVFRISPQGELLTSRVVKHAGHDILDRAAIEAIGDAAPFPKPPQRFRGRPLTMEVVLVFSLDSADRR